jgi:RHS repeat-associated protein
MGIGGWIKDRYDDAKDGVSDLVDQGTDVVDDVGDWAENAIDDGLEQVGEGVNWAADRVADGLDHVGAHDWADSVDRFGDDVSDALGGDVPEKELGETDDPKQIVHGEPEDVTAAATHLTAFADGFSTAGGALQKISVSEWTGEAASAFHATYDKHPALWTDAATACTDASSALDGYVNTLTWAQGQAKEAIALYDEGMKASKQAADDYNKAVDDYNDAASTYNDKLRDGGDAGTKPTPPGPFKDPGTAKIERARTMVDEARKQRDTAADEAAQAIRTATQAAPAEPAFHDRMLANGVDLWALGQYNGVHATMGVLKGTGDLLRFVRTLNLTDPYNLTHPAQYLSGLSNTTAGLIYGLHHPTELLSGMLGDGWGTDPAESLGKLVPAVVLAVATDGAGAAAGAGERGALGASGLADDLARAGGRSAEGLTERPGLLDDLARGSESRAGVGEPVDAATGEVYLQQTDLVLPGVLPLVLQRRYGSHWSYGRWFGPRWSSSFDERLDLAGDQVVMVTAEGAVVMFPHPEPESTVSASHGQGWTLTRTEVGGYRVDDPASGTAKHFLTRRLLGDGHPTIPLVASTDRHGNRLMYVRDEHDHPVEVRHSGGYRVLVRTDAIRITDLTVVHDDGSEPVTVARYAYASGNLTEVVNASGEALSFGYDDHDRLVEWLDRNGTSYTHAYDDRDRAVAQDGTAHAMAATFAYVDGEDGSHTTVMTDSLGHQHAYTSDARWQLASVTDPLGNTRRFTRDEAGRLVASTDPLGHTTRRTYDDRGDLSRIEWPTGAVQQIGWTDIGGRRLPDVVISPDGATTRVAYDERGNRVGLMAPDGTITTWTYDDRGRLTSVTDPLMQTTRIETDGAGLPVRITAPDGGVTSIVRDGFGRVTSVTDPVGDTISITRDAEGRPLVRTLADGREERYTYDAEGNLLETVDAAGRVTTLEYTVFDRLARQIAPDGGVTELEWDTNLRLRQVTNPAGLTWRYEYDAAGRVVAETDFDGRTQTRTYDAAGRVVRRSNGAGQQVDVVYDALGQVVSSTADGATTTFERDVVGRLVRAVNDRSEVAWEHDAMGRVLSESVDGRETRHVYDALGRRTGRTGPSGTDTTWQYGAGAAPTSVDVAGHVTRFGRDAVGRETRRELAGGTVLDQLWSPGGQLTAQVISAATGELDVVSGIAARMTGHALDHAPTPLQSRTYAYGPGGELVGIDDRLTGVQELQLDQLGRVVGVTGVTTEAYGYDPTGNIVTATTPDGSEARQLRGTRLLATDRARYSYDGQGRLTTKIVRRLDRKDDVWRYEWDALDRLTSVVTPDGTRWLYHYDPIGRRIAKQRLARDGSVAETVRFDWDGLQVQEQSDACGRTTSWVYEGLSPVAQLERTDDVDERFFSIVTDLVGAPSELVDEDGEIVWHARHSLWGASVGGAPAPPTPLRFPGQYADDESGLFYNVNRYYDPDTGRYLSQDPLGLAPAPNPAAYVANPHESIDPLGLAPCSVTDISGLPDDIVRLSESHVTDSGTTVLGRYEPQTDASGTTYPSYIDKAQSTGSSYYDIGDAFKRLSPDQQTAANMHFLDTRIAAQDRMVFSIPKQLIDEQARLANKALEEPPWLMTEIEYLTERGYEWKDQWSMGPR